jgi:integrase
MATIRTRKSGTGSTSYQAIVRLRGYPKKSQSFKRKTDATAWAARIEAALREERHLPSVEARKHTLGDLIDRWLEALELQGAERAAKQRQLLKWWKARLGDYAMSHITPAVIAQSRDALLRENIGNKDKPRHRSPATANRYLAALSKACAVATKQWHWLAANPVAQVQKEREPRGRVRFLSKDDELPRLLAACEKSSLPDLRLIVLLACQTGMRRGELLGLRWPDIDLQRAVAVLHKTKNNDRRAVPLSPDVCRMLAERRKVRHLDTDLLFSRNGKDQPVEIDNPFGTALRKAGIEDFRFHDLRHTAASYLAMSGATTAEIAAVLGHRTLQMVQRYAHLSEQHTGAVLERMTSKFFG